MTENVDLRNEHEALRNGVAFYDFTHELLEVRGPDAGKFLDKMFVNNIAGAKVEQAKYTTMLNESGHITDDVIIFRTEDETFWVSTLYIKEMLAWFDKYKEGYDLELEDITEKTTMYAVQGPKSREVLNDFLSEKIDDLKFNWISDNKIGDVPVKVARCGFTGELGYELYFAPEHIELVESKLYESGKQFNITEMTTDVILASIPSEKGYVLMRDLEGINPIEAGFGWTVDWSKDFVGKDKLEKDRADGPGRSLVGFTVEDDNAEVELESEIKVNGQSAGKVTNYTYGFTVEKNIGYALIDTSVAKVGDKATLVSGDQEVEATLTDRVFYDVDNARRAGKA